MVHSYGRSSKWTELICWTIKIEGWGCWPHSRRRVSIKKDFILHFNKKMETNQTHELAVIIKYLLQIGVSIESEVTCITNEFALPLLSNSTLISICVWAGGRSFHPLHCICGRVYLGLKRVLLVVRTRQLHSLQTSGRTGDRGRHDWWRRNWWMMPWRGASMLAVGLHRRRGQTCWGVLRSGGSMPNVNGLTPPLVGRCRVICIGTRDVGVIMVEKERHTSFGRSGFRSGVASLRSGLSSPGSHYEDMGWRFVNESDGIAVWLVAVQSIANYCRRLWQCRPANVSLSLSFIIFQTRREDSKKKSISLQCSINNVLYGRQRGRDVQTEPFTISDYLEFSPLRGELRYDRIRYLSGVGMIDTVCWWKVGVWKVFDVHIQHKRW